MMKVMLTYDETDIDGDENDTYLGVVGCDADTVLIPASGYNNRETHCR
jgi:hypothetical protein